MTNYNKPDDTEEEQQEGQEKETPKPFTPLIIREIPPDYWD